MKNFDPPESHFEPSAGSDIPDDFNFEDLLQGESSLLDDTEKGQGTPSMELADDEISLGDSFDLAGEEGASEVEARVGSHAETDAVEGRQVSSKPVVVKAPRQTVSKAGKKKPGKAASKAEKKKTQEDC